MPTKKTMMPIPQLISLSLFFSDILPTADLTSATDEDRADSIDANEVVVVVLICVILSAVAPTNHCEGEGALHGTDPAHEPARTCHATGVTCPDSMTADCDASAYRVIPTGDVDIEDVPVLRARVFGDVSEIAVVRPSVLGGQTTAGYASLNLLVVTV